ncbi:hypothetical protein DICPUDRAFT_55871 [Dictyostelium purpureum]|uniref:MPN domain-containing protein n=1 Tax=Dictyostelium purpureum TaxID=5786 RepID=F0ZNX3_DICPU|nr:uncharacterized protein DICPUDRAFT_55871 [Dictyostelium purpureum]EGC34367.1 hypothetical protein DICPUDRAFT_55871 [Dictyostelium purpureum]|eukprot:XP_003289101.1 hypothetical protein DICPUDRAFT_55871 [Dictyostelium purpureum]
MTLVNIKPLYISSSVQELVEKHCSIGDIDKHYSLFNYLSTSNNLYKQAAQYKSEGDLEKSYIYSIRFCSLLLEKLPKHPEYTKDVNKKSINDLKSKANQILSELESVKSVLDKGYILKVKEEERQKELERIKQEKIRKIEEENKRKLEEEKKRKEEEQRLREIEDELNQSIKIDAEKKKKNKDFIIDPSFVPPPEKEKPQPKLPPISLVEIPQDFATPATPATSTPANNIVKKPNIDSDEASKKYSKLRTINVDFKMFEDFMRLSENNTSRKIETCGILSGTLSNDVFTITTIIIPKQEGTTDTCNTIEEHEIFEYQLEHDLLTLGWVHTHPTQECFLSAVDLHTHCSYQYLLQEAIAVVIAPRSNPNFGIFRLTDPPGLETIQKCKLKSFHPHPPVNGVPVYTSCNHVKVSSGKFNGKVIDLRNKK